MEQSMGSGSVHSRQAGVAYLLLLVAIAIIGISAAAAVSIGSAVARRDAEVQLLAIGAEFQRALASYAGVPAGAAAAPGARGPRDLQDLLRDPRQPGIRRHLRKVYADPLTGKDDWGLLRDSEGFIVGVYSLADGRPAKRTGWPPEWSGFEDQDSYAGWVFGLRAAAALPR
jgi:type II secretory pathway pseudopilin PulG